LNGLAVSRRIERRAWRSAHLDLHVTHRPLRSGHF
jgi:hypothetical protein